ncbi:phosphoribosylformylglycinamidine synthase subunit PurL [Roseisolibacter sp. H3M3-2]|uniref:phosphoribosylformylglycinamidine synthase subunit PurL n=1 Tax=Roseisolibacter sp. H3M3-2 TaxID=3031323 RepID=UPI0023DA171F|nr:phosphoribosylformylglycinamidine synthase subunit PurL [Roseisolibacter sp. H3M3-2]MDF1501518.1 phosphoribosylformylglycinamidine synthase subunit PurL [Roseisolibacter sp. H3M3-2]
MPVTPRPGDPTITPALVAEHGITPFEYERLLAMLGREPTFTELGIVSALWSEHCSYKHSRPLLRTLPTEAPWVLQGPGENAGVIAVGDGLAVAFKIESHNHPSAVEPYQGAATGVGGILRDVFTMGARPIALLDSLRFGDLESPRVRYLFSGVVKGIGDYGNCVGIPTVAGEVVFDPAYEGNPLVNAMCVGLLKEEELIRAVAQGVGNPIIAVGARTGRDGIHGASFASEDLSEENEAKRPRVQVGDPFTEKLLLEASLELIRSGHIVAIQDMGAAGLTSSSAEMAARGDVGVVIDTTKVPAREEGMTPYELLLSESQERMLVVAKKGHEDDVAAILQKWDLTAAVIGEVIAEPVYRVTEGDRVVAEFPGIRLVTDCPTYEPEARESDAIRAQRETDVAAIAELPEESDPVWTLTRLLSSPTIASKRWVHRQYDTMVRTSTVIGPGGDAAVVRLRGTDKAVALKVDCNGRYCHLDPYEGAKQAVAEAARNVACAGGRPKAITNNLNFGNPKRPEVYFQLREAVRGMGEACRALQTPVTGGNVSLYNENPNGAIYPTPVIGMVGLVEAIAHVTPAHFRRAGDAIVLLGENTAELGGSEYLQRVHGLAAGAPPRVDLDAERRLIDALLDAIAGGHVASAHDCSDGGLAVALAECAVGDEERWLGADVDLSAWDALPRRALLFGEAQGRVVVSTAAPDAVVATAARLAYAARVVGAVAADAHGVPVTAAGGRFTAALAALADADGGAIPRLMERAASASATAGESRPHHTTP